MVCASGFGGVPGWWVGVWCCAPASNPPGTPGGGPYGPAYRGRHEPVPCPGGPAVSGRTGVGIFMRARAAPLCCLPLLFPPTPLPRRPPCSRRRRPQTACDVFRWGWRLRPARASCILAARPLWHCVPWPGHAVRGIESGFGHLRTLFDCADRCGHGFPCNGCICVCPAQCVKICCCGS